MHAHLGTAPQRQGRFHQSTSVGASDTENGMLLYREAHVWAFGSALYFQHGSLGPGAADKAMRASSLAGNPIESNSKGQVTQLAPRSAWPVEVRSHTAVC